MNALYTHALRQTQSITSDLALLENALAGSSTNTHTPYDTRSPSPSAMSPSLQGNGVDTAGLNGQIVASLAALQRTVDDYEGMARRELVEDKKGKAARWVPLLPDGDNPPAHCCSCSCPKGCGAAHVC